MCRLLVAFFLCVACLICAVTLHADDEQTRAGLLDIQESLPELKADLDLLSAGGQDVSYPMVSYTILENSCVYALRDLYYGLSDRAATQLSDLILIKNDLDQEVFEALAGNRTFPKVPRWTGQTRPVIKSSSFIAPMTIPGRSCAEYRPVFFNGYGHFGQVQADIEKWPNYGINIIQFEIGPWSVFPSEGTINYGVINSLAANLDRAQAAGVAVNLLISPHYFPSWMLTKYPKLKKSRSGFLQYCTHAPEGQELLKQFITTLITPVKDKVALHSICLSNEPRNIEEPCEYATAEFREWLEDRHGSISVLNDRWGTSYTSFDEITPPNPLSSSAQTPLTRWFDFVRWNQEFFTSWHKMLADAVHAVAPDIPVHAKVQGYTFGNTGEQKCGNDPYLYSGIMDISGNDNSNYYNFGSTDYANGFLATMLYYDLQRSMIDLPVFNSENHTILDGETRVVPAKHIREALWQDAIHGQSASTMWVWEYSYTPGDGLFGNILSRPACARAVGIVNLDENRAAREITALQQAPDQVCILHSTSGLVYEGELYDRCLFRAYMAFNFCGVKIGLITERQLEEGILPKTSVLCIPNSSHLTKAAYQTLKKYTGHLVFIGSECLMYDEYNKPRTMSLTADLTMPFVRTSTWEEDIYAAVLPKLIKWGVLPEVAVVDSNGNRVWGIEYKVVETSDGTLVNLANYLNKTLTVKLSRDGSNVRSLDVLTDESINGTMTLEPLDFKLLRVID